jgi:serine/threonine-protein kinase
MVMKAELGPGARLGRYTIEGVLGRGALTVVYAARDEQLGRRVALKVLTPPPDERDRFRERFMRESRLAASIDHPHVIPVYEAGEGEGGELFIAMRLVDGTDLRALLARAGVLEPGRALAIVGQAASALDAAHARGLLHRDVKPGNILIAADDGEEHVYLSDFGIAVPGEEWVGAASFQGTAEYAAPEQIEGRAEARSDVYGLACVLYECLAGRPPFRRTRLLSTLWSQLNDDAPPASLVNEELPVDIDGVLASALSKEPADRPPTCAALVSSARAALGVEERSSRRLWVALVAAGVTVLAAVALTLGVTAGGKGAPSGPVISTFAGTGEPGASGDGGPARDAQLNYPSSIAVDRHGNVYVADDETASVRRIAADGRITRLAGPDLGRATGTAGLPARDFPGALSLGLAPTGDLYVADAAAPILLAVGPNGDVHRVAGTGVGGVIRPGASTPGPALCIQASSPAFDPEARLYLACPTANRIVRVEDDGSLTVVAGNGEPGFAGDGGPASKAELDRPVDMAFDRAGNLYIADLLNNRVRKVDTRGVITTLAGTGGMSLSGDGWLASSVDLGTPTAVTADPAGNVYVVEGATHRVRRIDRQGRIWTAAGNGTTGYSGDGGPPAAARLDPWDVAVGPDGSLYIAESSNNRIRRVTP